MPEVGYMVVDDIDGESNIKDHEDEIEVLQFDHEVNKAVDPLDCSKVTGDRRHGTVQVTKIYDKATPLLNQKLCEGGTIGQIEIKWFRQPADGSDPEHYFTHTFKDCIVTGVRPWMPNALDPSMNSYKHMEVLTFGYKQVTWKSETGGTEFADEVRG